MNLIRYNPSVDLLDNVSRWFDDIVSEPFFGATYLPPDDRHGRPGLATQNASRQQPPNHRDANRLLARVWP